MASQIDPSKPLDGTPAIKTDLRTNLAAAKSEIEALQDGKAPLAHTHGVGDLIAGGSADGTRFLRGDGVWERPRVTEVTVSGTRTLGAAELGTLLTYTGSGNGWTLTNPGGGGEIAVENDGTGTITLTPNGVTIVNGVLEIGAGKSASLRFFSSGSKVKVFVET